MKNEREWIKNEREWIKNEREWTENEPKKWIQKAKNEPKSNEPKKSIERISTFVGTKIKAKPPQKQTISAIEAQK
jgi:hypothetical protein